METKSPNLQYAGIGARNTPQTMLNAMGGLASNLGRMGFQLRSGGARGADMAFHQGAVKVKAKSIISLPWDGYNGQLKSMSDDMTTYTANEPSEELIAIAKRFHPAWENLSVTIRLFMVRNAEIILGPNCNDPVSFVICWTEQGKTTGGTGHGIRICDGFDIPVYNLARTEDQQKLITMLEPHTQVKS